MFIQIKVFLNALALVKEEMQFHLSKKLKTLNSLRHSSYLPNDLASPLDMLRIQHSGQSTARSLKSELYELHKVATDWFHQRLLDENDESNTVRKYWLDERKFSMETAKRFALGILRSIRLN